MSAASINPDNFPAFAMAHAKAVTEGKEVFTFEGAQVDINYAAYVLEFFDTFEGLGLTAKLDNACPVCETPTTVCHEVS